MSTEPDYGTATLGVSTGEIYRVIGPDGSVMCECEDESTAMQINTALMLLGPLRETNRRLVEALRPFADNCDELYNDWCPDETPAWYGEDDENGITQRSPITVGNFRAARALLSELEQDKSDEDI